LDFLHLYQYKCFVQKDADVLNGIKGNVNCWFQCIFCSVFLYRVLGHWSWGRGTCSCGLPGSM